MRTLKILALLLLALLLTSTVLAQSEPVVYRLAVGEQVEIMADGTVWRVECGVPQPVPPVSPVHKPDPSIPDGPPDPASPSDVKTIPLESAHDARFGLEGVR